MHEDAHQPVARARFVGRVEQNELICREHYRLRVRIDADGPSFPATRPGQFIQLGCRSPQLAPVEAGVVGGREWDWQPGAQPAVAQTELCESAAFLRRPFSLAGRGDDEAGTWLDIIHRVVGKGTRWLASLERCDAVDLIGPLGNAFTIDAQRPFGLLVGGGVGLPPMFYLAEAIGKAGGSGVGFVGAMTRDLLAVRGLDPSAPSRDGKPADSVEDFARHGFQSIVTTDDGSCGLPGRITSGLERFLERSDADARQKMMVYTCGPEPMMKAVADLAVRFDLPCEVCLEQAMACGMGTCQSCIVRIEGGYGANAPRAAHGTDADGRGWRYNLACTDGPVFPAEAVVW